MTEAQQTQLAGQVDRIRQTESAAIEELKARYAQQGITDPRAIQAGITRIQELAGAHAEQAKAGAAETARSTRERANAALIDLFMSLSGRGLQTQGNSAAGIANIGEGAQGAANQGNSLAANLLSNVQSGASGMAQHYQSTADQLQQNAQQVGASGVNDLMSLLTFGLTGGFSTPRSTPPITGSGSGVVLPEWWGL